MTGCTFVYSVINLTSFKQYVFLILGIRYPAPMVTKGFIVNALERKNVQMKKIG